MSGLDIQPAIVLSRSCSSSTPALSASGSQHLTMPGNFAPFEAKMRADGLSDAAVAAFKNAYDALTSGD